MSIAAAASVTPCLYQFDRDRTCGGVVQYTADGSPVTSPSGVSSAAAPSATPQSGSNAGDAQAQNTDSIGFSDILDIINPLQHLPIVGWAYRRATGDTIKPVPAMMGGAIFGGGVGLLSSAVREMVINAQEQQTDGRLAAVASTSTPKPDHQADPSKSSGYLNKIDIAWNAISNTPHATRRESFDREQTAGSIVVYG